MKNQEKTPASTAGTTSAEEGGAKVLIPVNKLEQLKKDIEKSIALIQSYAVDAALSTAERRRLLGSGVRRYGFIDKVSDVATANPEFVPSFMDTKELKDLIRQIELLRNIAIDLQQLARIVNDELLISGDEAFRIALMYYNAVRDAANRRVPRAQAIFQALSIFFRRSRRKVGEPTEAELERDFRALLHGTKDGEIIVRNQNPTTSGKVHEVVDNTHSPRTHNGLKATIDEKITE